MSADYTPAQIEDFATLFAREMPRGNLVWLVTQMKAPYAGAETESNDLAFAREIVDALVQAGKLGDAVALLRKSKKASLLTLGLSYIQSKQRLASSAQYQAFINRHQPFITSAPFMEAFPRIARTVCAIGIGGNIEQIMGTGFLVGPDLVLTNAHVVAPLLDFETDPPAENGSGDDLICFFDYTSEPSPKLPYQNDAPSSFTAVHALQQGWLRAARGPLANDGTQDAPDDAENFFDYALIQLRQKIGMLPTRRSGGEPRGWLPVPADELDVDTKDQRIVVHQHPQAFPLQFDIGDYDGTDKSGTRVRYKVSTAHGSSGGAAVDVDGNLFALHNAEVLSDGAAESRLNQGVRIDKIAADLDARLPQWDDFVAAIDEPFWSLSETLDDPKPVIGRDDFRQSVVAMAAPDGRRVMVVWGPPGSGKRFSVELLRRTLDPLVRIVQYSADDLTTSTPGAVAEKLMTGTGLTEPADDPMPKPNPTEALARWDRTDLAAWVARMLARLAGETPSAVPVWLVFHIAVDDFKWKEPVSDFVAALAGVHDAGQAGVEQPHLRLLFLASSPALLPIGNVPRFEDDLTVYTTHAAEFEACVRRAYFALDKVVDFQPPTFLGDLAGATADDLDPMARRKALSNLVRKLVLTRLKQGQPG